VILPSRGRVGEIGGCPGIVNACGGAIYHRKRVVEIQRCRRLCALSRPAASSWLASIRAGYQLFHERGPDQALRDNERIVAKCIKEFLKHVGLFGIPRDPIHLCLQLLRRDRWLPRVLQRL
jgi:hypothetical protein